MLCNIIGHKAKTLKPQKLMLPKFEVPLSYKKNTCEIPIWIPYDNDLINIFASPILATK